MDSKLIALILFLVVVAIVVIWGALTNWWGLSDDGDEGGGDEGGGDIPMYGFGKLDYDNPLPADDPNSAYTCSTAYGCIPDSNGQFPTKRECVESCTAVEKCANDCELATGIRTMTDIQIGQSECEQNCPDKIPTKFSCASVMGAYPDENGPYSKWGDAWEECHRIGVSEGRFTYKCDATQGCIPGTGGEGTMFTSLQDCENNCSQKWRVDDKDNPTTCEQSYVSHLFQLIGQIFKKDTYYDTEAHCRADSGLDTI